MSASASPEDVSDNAIRAAYARSSLIIFSARPFNHIPWRQVTFGNLGWWLPLDRVLQLIGITPKMLYPVFAGRTKTVPRRFPFNLSWFGLNKQTNKLVSAFPPERITTYEDLGAFMLQPKPFVKLSQILGKSIEVLREDGYTGVGELRFTVHPSGVVVYPLETEAEKPE